MFYSIDWIIILLQPTYIFPAHTNNYIDGLDKGARAHIHELMISFVQNHDCSRNSIPFDKSIYLWSENALSLRLTFLFWLARFNVS